MGIGHYNKMAGGSPKRMGGRWRSPLKCAGQKSLEKLGGEDGGMWNGRIGQQQQQQSPETEAKTKAAVACEYYF
jgi:hypothetical protein